MQNINRNAAFLDLLGRCLVAANKHMTANMLGDRSQYVGLSDLAKYRECPRAAITGKIASSPKDMDSLLPLMRGHWFEDGIADCFDSLGLASMRQLEIRYEHKGVPIRAHLDICLVSDNPRSTVRIVEVKSTATLPTSARPAHEYQARAQVTLLQDLWNRPVFTLRQTSGAVFHANVTFPELCRSHLNINLPDNPDLASVESWLLCLDMKQAVAFGPYTFAPEMLRQLQSDAYDFWEGVRLVQSDRSILASVRCADGFNLLCTSCPFNMDCPKFRLSGDALPQWGPALAKLSTCKESKAMLDQEIKELERALRQAYSLSGSRDWINAGQYRFRVSQMPGRRSFNKSVLADELNALFAHEGITRDVPALLANCEREGAPYSTLRVMPNAA